MHPTLLTPFNSISHMNTIVVDLSQKGLLMFLKPHEVELMRAVWAAEDPIDSRTAWGWLLAREQHHTRSRATVINFLKAAADRGWLEMTQRGVKGGEPSLYVPHPNFPCEVSFTQELAMRVVKSMGDLLGVSFMVKQKRVSEE